MLSGAQGGKNLGSVQPTAVNQQGAGVQLNPTEFVNRCDETIVRHGKKNSPAGAAAFQASGGH
jgi:hypothetical protein